MCLKDFDVEERNYVLSQWEEEIVILEKSLSDLHKNVCSINKKQFVNSKTLE